MRGLAGLAQKRPSAVEEAKRRREESSSDEDEEEEQEEQEEEEEKRAAWVDEDEPQVDLRVSRLKKLRKTSKERRVAGSELERRLRRRYGSEAWARKRETTKLETLAASSEKLVDEARLDVVRRIDANGRDPSKSVVKSLDFRQNLLLTAGLDRHIRLFDVDGERNEHRLSFFAEDLPFSQAKFINKKIVAAGRRPYFYFFDIETTKATRIRGETKESLERFAVNERTIAFTANDGRIRCCDAKSGLWAHTDLRINGSVRSLAFHGDDLYAGGGDGDIYRWDLRMTARCLAKFEDLGKSTTSAIAVSTNLLAVGSEAGVVNLYDRHPASSSSSSSSDDNKKPTFKKAIMNLTTPIDSIVLTPNFLVLASKWSKDALRVVNLRTTTVFSNWPTAKTPLHYVSALAFYNDFLAIGNDKGRVLLYQLKSPAAPY